MSRVKKALVLSGGGGRGAYHVGVIETLVEQGWMEDGKGPDILAGTSIGAINAAALASGMTVAELKQRWMAMHSEDVHRLSDDVPTMLRPFVRFLLNSVLTSQAHGGTNYELSDEERTLNAGRMLERFGQLFRARPFRSLLDTTPWRKTLSQWMDFERINSPNSPALLLTATDVQRGTLRIFSNRERNARSPDAITLDHLMASCSIPAVYPWTTIDGFHHWDGAVLANTPLGAVIDLVGADEQVDILVVMMTPWLADLNESAEAMPDVPHDLMQAMALTLDWTLLASYRSDLKLLTSYNRLVDAAEQLERAADQTGDESLRIANLGLRHITLPTVIAPRQMMPMEWIVDYEEQTHEKLFAMGKADALNALIQRSVG